jgi:hypothetical protein
MGPVTGDDILVLLASQSLLLKMYCNTMHWGPILPINLYCNTTTFEKMQYIVLPNLNWIEKVLQYIAMYCNTLQ